MPGNKPPDTSLKPLVVQPNGARQLYGGCSTDEIYEKIKNNEVDSYLDGRRRLITVESIERDIARGIAAATAAGFKRSRFPDPTSRRQQRHRGKPHKKPRPPPGAA